MTIFDVLAELPRLGPWRLVPHPRVNPEREGIPPPLLRNAAGQCPLAAIARAQGFAVEKVSRDRVSHRPQATTFGPDRLAMMLGMAEHEAEDLADAADGTAARFHPELRALRRLLLAACGLTEVEGVDATAPTTRGVA